MKRVDTVDVGKRKHVSQMTNLEKDFIWEKLKGVHGKDWKPVPHVFDRLREKNIQATVRDLVSAIHNSEIIEYRIVHNKRTGKFDERVIIRANSLVNRYYNLNVVFSITGKRIITTWINHKNDKHSTLDWSIYDKNMRVYGM